MIVTVLVVMVLLAVVLSITTTTTLTAVTNTSDQRSTQQAQSAAESGVSLASAKMQQVRNLLTTVEVPQGTDLATIKTLIKQYCGVNDLATPPEIITTPILACTADPIIRAASRLEIFQKYVDTDAYSDVNVPTSKIANYWSEMFGLNTPVSTGTVSTSGALKTSYSTNFHLIPTRVLQTGEASYQILYRSDTFASTGQVKQSTDSTASRSINIAQSNEFYVVIQRPAFNAFAQFRDLTTATTGGQLSFGDGEKFNGPVHTNSQPGFIGTPTFYSQFTTAATTASFSSPTTACNTVSKLTSGQCTSMFPNLKPKFGVPKIDLPTNNNNQLRATFGGDTENFSTVSDTELKNAWGVNSMANNTVYYAKGNGSAANNTNAWLGGIYINGDADVTFKRTNTGQQQIIVVQGSTTNTFEKLSTGSWTVKVNNAAARTISGKFNGMIYSTGALNVYGDGNNSSPDISSDTQITLTNVGNDKNIVLKDSVTYTDNPIANPDATNVLGIYSNGGSILLDGPNNKDMIMNASILATRSGEGFGSVNASTQRYTGGNTQPKIILTGGVIESQSQTVSSGNGGYRRDYTYDKRFATGFSPPYFPLQQRWTTEVDTSPLTFGFWKQSK